MRIKQTINDYFSFVFLIIPATWAGSFIAGKYVVEGIDPLSAVFWRFLLSALVMFPPLLLFYRHRHPNLKEYHYLKHLFIVTLSAGIIYHSLMFGALQTTSPTNTALIIALNPFFTAFAEIFLFKAKQKTRFYAGFMIAFTGAIWVNISRGDTFTLPGYGELLCLLASLTWSFYSLYAKKSKQPDWDPIWLGAYSYLLTALLILPFISQPVFFMDLTEISGMVWMGLLYMAVFPTAIGYTLYYIGVQKRGRPGRLLIFI